MPSPNTIQLPALVGEWLSDCGAVITAELKRKSGDVVLVGANFTMMMSGVPPSAMGGDKGAKGER